MAVEIARHRFTVADYEKMGDTGILRESDRVELLAGEIVEMSPIDPPHAGAVNALNHVFAARFADRAILTVQNPIVILPDSEPQPDIVALRPRADFYSRAHGTPQDVFLLVEVADTSLRFDRLVKLPIYARADISEVWIVNVNDRAIEVYREPRSGIYTESFIVQHDERVAPSAFPDISLAVAEVLVAG